MRMIERRNMAASCLGLTRSQPWYKFPLLIAELKLDLTLACGQSFRWQEVHPGVWSSVLAGRVWFLSQTPEELLYQAWCHEDIVAVKEPVPGNKTSPAGHLKDEVADLITDYKDCEKNTSAIQSGSMTHNDNEKLGPINRSEDEEILRDYFQLDVSIKDLYEQWCECDPVFRDLAGSFSGIRILRQDPVENLFAFICSSNNHISRISSMVEKLCEHYGPKIGIIEGRAYYGFPNVESLAGNGVEEKLRSLGFGYRAKYISASARFIQQQSPDWLMELRGRPYEEAKRELMRLTGVGAKVADCVCLMSLDKHGAIPVDTHVWQFAMRDYMPKLKQCKSLTDSVYKSIGDFFRELWGEYAGWAQSVLFSADLKKFQDRKVKKVNGAQSNDKPESANKKKKVKQSAKRKCAVKLESAVDCDKTVLSKHFKKDKDPMNDTASANLKTTPRKLRRNKRK